MINYLTITEVLMIHEELIAEFGGIQGLRDIGALEAALIRPQLGYYETLEEQGAALMESLALNHAFIDGNKRAAFFVVDVFFRMNGKQIVCDNKKAYAHFMKLFKESNFKYELLLKWLKKNTYVII